MKIRRKKFALKHSNTDQITYGAQTPSLFKNGVVKVLIERKRGLQPLRTYVVDTKYGNLLSRQILKWIFSNSNYNHKDYFCSENSAVYHAIHSPFVCLTFI